MSASRPRAFSAYDVPWKNAVFRALRDPGERYVLESGLSEAEAKNRHRRFDGLRAGVRAYGEEGCEGLLGAVRRGELRFEKLQAGDGSWLCLVYYDPGRSLPFDTINRGKN